MNRINPKKLLLSKWTAVKPENKERHFIVTKLLRGDDEQITGCQLEAVINKKSCVIDWQQLRDSSNWIMGWK
ncbi:MAG: TIGR02450 family Trp-rich protein [Gammaproteobacteria bacterium]|nr:TIGR02450 family Trp-rich protein [Gammaproteobacteria bacterium]MBT8134924.1 TIGR02450 family Trp-rich protein [Gammaproteobacteria bacterium]NNJ49519.1 TIGR02450 family Trp-rich protein [Gammaproteobacteria bacterium]